MNPSIGAIVHWVDDNGVHLPAIVTSPGYWPAGTTIDLVVFGYWRSPAGWQLIHVGPDELKSRYTWHWPEVEP